MALWELDEFKIANFLGYVRGIPAPEEFSGASLLPNLNTDDLDFEYILGASRTPVMAHVMGFDSEAPIAGGGAKGSKVGGELPPIKRKAKFTEKDIIRFLRPRLGSNDIQFSIDSVYDQTDELVFGVQARVEWLRMKALSEDTVVYDEGGVIFEFDYDYDDTLQIDLPTNKNGAGTTLGDLVGAAWSDTENSDPLKDLMYVSETVRRKTGRRPATFHCSPEAVGYLQQSKSLFNYIRGDLAPRALLTLAEIENLFAVYSLPTIVQYDVRVVQEKADGTREEQRPLRADRGFFLPAASVGNTLWGPTAESQPLLGTTLANEAPGIVAVTYATVEPPSEWVKVAATAFPTIPQAHEVAQIELF